MVVEVTSESEFQRLISGPRPALVDFTASWCGPCRAIAPKFEQLSQKYAGKIEFLKVDVDASQSIARQQMISGMPTFVLYVKGQRKEQVVGADLNALILICQRYADTVATSFAGTGRKLSDASPTSPPETNQATNSAQNETSNLDPSAPTTSLQIRLADGSRHIMKFNTTSTIGELRRQIGSKTTGSQNFNLMAGMPPKYITTDEDTTIEQAELEGAVIIQRPV